MSSGIEIKKEELLKLKRDLERESFRSSLSKTRFLYRDYQVLGDIFAGLYMTEDDYGFSSAATSRIPNSKLNRPTKFMPTGMERTSDYKGYHLASILDSYLSLFKDEGYYCFDTVPKINISRKDRDDILLSYMDSVIPNGAKIFKERLELFDILVSEYVGDEVGYTYDLSTKNRGATIFLSPELKGTDIEYMRVLVHEFFHLYTSGFSKNYSSTVFEALDFGNLTEAASVYSEISFMQYLIDHHIFSRETTLNFNNYLDIILEYFLQFKYFYTCLDNGCKVNIFEDGYAVESSDEIKKEIEGAPYYLKGDSFDFGDFYDFKYVLGFMKAMDFYNIEKNGGNVDRALREFISSIGSPDVELDVLVNSNNDELVKSLVRKNMDDCKRLYHYK